MWRQKEDVRVALPSIELWFNNLKKALLRKMLNFNLVRPDVVVGFKQIVAESRPQINTSSKQSAKNCDHHQAAVLLNHTFLF